MQTSHSERVAELEKRLLDQDLKYKADIGERDIEISGIQQSAQDRLRDVQSSALSEKEALQTQIRFVSSDLSCEMLSEYAD